MYDKRAMVLELLDEALIQRNPLSIYSSFTLFSNTPELVGYDFDDSQQGPLFSASEEYEKLVKRTVLLELDNIKRLHSIAGQLTQAGVIDLCVLIHQHFRSLTCIQDGLTVLTDIQYDPTVLNAVIITSKFSDIVIDAYYVRVKYGTGRETAIELFKTICDQIRNTHPYSAAAFHRVLDPINLGFLNNFRSYIKESHKMFKIHELLAAPQSKDDFRIYLMILTRTSVNAFHQTFLPDFYSFREEFYLLDAYELVKSVRRNFGESLTEKLIRKKSSVFLESLKVRMQRKLSRLPLQSILIIVKWSIYLGMFDAVLYIVSEFSTRFSRQDMITLVHWSTETQQHSFTEYFLNYLKYDESLMNLFAAKAPFKIFEKMYYSFRAQITVDSLKFWMTEAIQDDRFLTLNFIASQYLFLKVPIPQIDQKSTVKLISRAIENHLPETNIREYIEYFGTEILKEGQNNHDLFVLAGAHGYVNLLENFGPYDNRKLLETFKGASRNKEHESLKYLINLIPSTADINLVAPLIESLVIDKNRDALECLIEKLWGDKLSGERKA